jgi:glycine cleavage system transcriptional repressor
MRTSILFTLTGPDRVGVVEEVTSVLLGLDANIESSRMARLGGEFAILMLLDMPAEKTSQLESAFSSLAGQGYQLTAKPTSRVEATGRPYRVEVRGADHEGIIRQIAKGLAESGVNMESVETGTSQAPNTGTLLFTMSALVAVPETVEDSDWISALMDAGEASGVDVEVSEA